MIFVTLETRERMRLESEKNLISTSLLVGKKHQSECEQLQ